MNFDAIYIKKGILRVVSVHFVSLFITAFLTFFVPKLLNNYDYGVWQLYVFYFGYIGFFHIGWADGVYLNLLGEDFTKLKRGNLKTEAILFLLFQLIVAIILFIVSFFIREYDKSVVIKLLSLTLVITNFRYYFIYILQACGKVREYSNVQLYERILIVVVFIFAFFIKKDYFSIIIADIISKLLTLFISMYYCKEILLASMVPLKNISKSIFTNISDGSKLMIANIVSMLTTGVIKFGIEQRYGLIKFGKVALALTFSNLCVSVLNSMGIVFIPMIRNIESSASKNLYEKLHDMINIFTFFIMIFYYPIKVIATIWLPDYSDSFVYLSITFPIIYFCCLQALLLTTYMKALRQEKLLLISNITVVIFAIIYAIISIYVLKNFLLCVLGLSIVYFIKISIYEYVVNIVIKSKNYIKYIFESLILCSGFSVFNYCVKGIFGMMLYLTLFVIYFIVNFNDFRRLNKLFTK